MSTLEIFYEATPNPHSLKFITTEVVADRTQNFTEATQTSQSPLAAKLFGFPWCKGVFVGPNFVTVTKEDWVDWETLAEPLSQIMKEHFENGGKALLDPIQSQSPQNSEKSDLDPISQKINDIINSEIRPAVAMDGGDIVFDHFKDGVVYLHMMGACSGCPSSSFTLKEGIESRLKDMIPEVTEVVAI